MAIMGHSMGATILQPALLYEPRFRAAILSGGGGSYLENLVFKQSPIDVKPLAELILRYRKWDREIHEHDPVVSLVLQACGHLIMLDHHHTVFFCFIRSLRLFLIIGGVFFRQVFAARQAEIDAGSFS